MAIKSIQIRDFFATNNPISDSANLLAPSSFANIEKHSGFTSPNRRVPGYQKPNRDGYKRVNQLYGQRKLGFSFRVYGQTQAHFEDIKSKLVDAADFRHGTQTMTIKSHDNRFYQVDGIVDMLSDTGKLVYNEEQFMMTFLCDTHTFSDLGLDGNGESIILTLADSLSGLEYVIGGGAEYPAEYSLGNIEARTIDNTGTAKVFPMIRLSGPLNQPTVTNTTNGKSFKLNVFIEADEYVDIDMDRQTVIDNTGASLFAHVDPSLRSFWELELGENIIEFKHNGLINDVARCRISWKPAVLSI